MIKSMVFRELKILKKSYFATLLMIIGMTAFMLLASYVLITLEIDGNQNVEGFALFMTYMLSLVVAGALTSDDIVLKSDMACGWHRYSLVLPLTSKDRAMAKYITKAIVIAVGGILVAVMSVPVFLLGKSDYSLAPVYLYICAVDFFLIYDIIRQSILMRATDLKSFKKLSVIAGVVIVALVLVLEFAFSGASELSTKIEKVFAEIETADSPTILNKYVKFITMPAYVGAIAFVLMLVILFVSFLITKKNYERRED